MAYLDDLFVLSRLTAVISSESEERRGDSVGDGDSRGDFEDLLFHYVTQENTDTLLDPGTVKQFLLDPIINAQKARFAKITETAVCQRVHNYVLKQQLEQRQRRSLKNADMSGLLQGLDTRKVTDEERLYLCLLDAVMPDLLCLTVDARKSLLDRFSEELASGACAVKGPYLVRLVDVLVQLWNDGEVNGEVQNVFRQIYRLHSGMEDDLLGDLAIVRFVVKTFGAWEDYSWLVTNGKANGVAVFPGLNVVDFSMDGPGMIGLAEREGVVWVDEATGKSVSVKVEGVRCGSKICCAWNQCFVLNSDGACAVLDVTSWKHLYSFVIDKGIDLQSPVIGFGALKSHLVLVQKASDGLSVSEIDATNGSCVGVHAVLLENCGDEMIVDVSSGYVHVIVPHWWISVSFDGIIQKQKRLTGTHILLGHLCHVHENKLFYLASLPNGNLLWEDSDRRDNCPVRGASNFVFANKVEQAILDLIENNHASLVQLLRMIWISADSVKQDDLIQYYSICRESLDAAVRLIQSCIEQHRLSLKLRSSITVAALHIVAIGLFELAYIRPDDDALRLESVREVLQQLCTMDVMVDEDIMSSLLFLLSISFRIVFDKHYDQYRTIIQLILKSESMASYFCKCLVSVPRQDCFASFLLYTFDEIILQNCQQLHSASALQAVFGVSLRCVWSEWAFLDENYEFSAMELMVPYFHAFIQFIAQDFNTNIQLWVKLMIELMSIEPTKYPTSWSEALLNGVGFIKYFEKSIFNFLTSDLRGVDKMEHVYVLLDCCMFSIGKILSNMMLSSPVSPDEEQFKFILESGIFDGVPSDGFLERETDITASMPSRIGSRTLSGGLSFDQESGDAHSAALQKDFLMDILHPKDQGIAATFMEYMYSSIPYFTRRHTVSAKMADIERWTVASLLKHAGLTNSALTFAMNIKDAELQLSKEAIPASLLQVWRTLYRTRTEFTRIKQNLSATDPEERQAEYDGFLAEVRLKLKYLLYSNPLGKDGSRSIDIEKTLKMVVAFITSPVKMRDLKRLIEVRTARASQRLHGLRVVETLMQMGLSQRSLLVLWTTFDTDSKILAKVSDILSVKASLQEEVSKSTYHLLQHCVDILAQQNLPQESDVCFSILLASHLCTPVEQSLRDEAFVKLLDCVAASNNRDRLSIFTIWSILAILVSQGLSSVSTEKVLSLNMSQSDINLYRQLPLLTMIPWPEDKQQRVLDVISSYLTLDEAFVTKIAVITVCEVLRHNTSDCDHLYVTVKKQRTDIRGFFDILLLGIGSALAGGDCLITKHDQEAQLDLASEAISYFRLMMKSQSHVCAFVKSFLHNSLASCEDWEHDKLSRQRLTAVFAILGKELIPFQEGGYTACFTRSGVRLAKVLSHDPISHSLFCDSLGTFSDCEFAPSTRVLLCPSEFELTEQEVHMLHKIHVNYVSNKQLDVEFLSLFAHFYGFMVVAFQSTPNMTKLVKSGGFLDYLGLNVDEKEDDMSIPMLINEVASTIVKIANVRKHIREPQISDASSGHQFLGMRPNSKVIGNKLKMESDLAVFVVPHRLSAEDEFYFELSSEIPIAAGMYIGFLDCNGNFKQEYGFSQSFYGLDIARNVILSPNLISPEHAGSWPRTVGCGIVHGVIFFCVDGQVLEDKMEYHNTFAFMPIVISVDEPRELSYKFVMESVPVDIRNIVYHYRETEILPEPKVSKQQKQLPTVNSNTWTAFKSALGQPFIQGERTKLRSRAHKISEHRLRNADIQLGAGLSVGSDIWLLGQTVEILAGTSRRILPKRIGVITNVEQTSLPLRIMLRDVSSQTQCSCKVCEQDISARKAKIGCLVDNTVYLSCTRDIPATVEEDKLLELSSWLYNSETCRLRRLVRVYAARNMRYLTCSILDYFSYQNRLEEIVSKEEIRKPLIGLISEVFPVSRTCKVWNRENIRQNDSVIHSATQDSQAAKLAGDRRAYSRCFKALAIKDSANMQVLFDHIVRDQTMAILAMKEDKNLELSEQALSFDIVRFGSSHSTSISHRLGKDVAGFIPVALTRSDLLMVNSTKVTPGCHPMFIEGQKVDVSFADSECSCLRLRIIPIPKYIGGRYASTALLPCHVVSKIVSVCLSVGGYSGMSELLQLQLLPALFDALSSECSFAFISAWSLCGKVMSMFVWDEAKARQVLSTAHFQVDDLLSFLEHTGTASIDFVRFQMSAVIMNATAKMKTIEQMINSRLDCSEEVSEYLSEFTKMATSDKDSDICNMCGFLSEVFDCQLQGRENLVHFLIASDWLMYMSKESNAVSFFIDNFSLFMKDCEMMQRYWTTVHDESLTKIIYEDPRILFRDQLDTEAPEFLAEPILLEFPREVLFCRLRLIRRAREIFELISTEKWKPLRHILPISFARVLATDKKMSSVEQHALQDVEREGRGITVLFNRFKASFFYSHPDSSEGQPLLYQFMEQVHNMDDLKTMKKRAAPWRVQLVGEGSMDAGGPGRDLFSDVCMELIRPCLGLFIQCPNGRRGDGPQQDCLIPNPQPLAPNSQKEMAFFYAGFFMALSFITKSPEPFPFPIWIYRYLTSQTLPSVRDIYNMDQEFKDLMNSIDSCHTTMATPDQFQSLFPYNFEIQDSTGKMVELFPGGSRTPVTYARRMEFVKLAKAYRTEEFTRQLQKIGEGFHFLLPSSGILGILPWELELMVCGSNDCPVSQMKQHIEVHGADPSVSMLWSVLESFTPKERMLFIKFGCGRMGLPPPGTSWPTPLVIHFVLDTRPDKAKSLPQSMTCQSTITMPYFSSPEWMAKKIRAALQYSASIDLDLNARVSDVREFT